MGKSSFERVVGNIPEETKEQILREAGEKFDAHATEELDKQERIKTPEELQIISLANEATNQIRQKYGLENFDIPPENFHIVPKELWKKRETDAFYASSLQGVALKEQRSDIMFMKKTLHEMIHFKSYNAMQMTNGESPEPREYRVGLYVQARDGKTNYLKNLNEAVTEEMTKSHLIRQFNNPLFAKDREQTKGIMTRNPNAVAESNEPMFDEETFYAWIENDTSATGRQTSSIFAEKFGYPELRKILNILIDKLFERNPGEFKDREEVFEVFAKGMMTGNILPVGKLIESTFGNGTLRKIGELDNDVKAQEEFVNAL